MKGEFAVERSNTMTPPPPGNEESMSSVTAECGGQAVLPQIGNGSCGCKGTNEDWVDPAFVYTLGRIEPRFPSLAVEREFVQATGRGDSVGLTDRQSLHAVLTRRENRYLVRQLCWVLTVEGLEMYLVAPRESSDLDLLVETLRPAPRLYDVDVVIGRRGPLAPPSMCNGLVVPIVVFDQIYSFDVDSLLKSIPRPEALSPEMFGPAAEELFLRILQMADNAGATDEHRALNYLAVRYNKLYAQVTELFGRNFALESVHTQPSRLSRTRNILDVIFSYRHRETDVAEQYFVRVDVTEAFPFLVTKLSPYYTR
jgi:hypothetical protein